MFKTSTMIAGLGLALSATAYADTYNWEAGAIISGGDVDGVAAGGSYFLDSVDDSNGPLGEAAFIDRASQVNIFIGENEVDEFETDYFSLSGRYVVKDAGWIFDAGYVRQEPENLEVDAFNIGVGKYIAPNTTLVLNYLRTDVENIGDADTYGVDIEHLANFGDNAVKFWGSYAYVDPDGGDDADLFSAGATWYPCKMLGIGASYSFTEQEGGDVDEFGISAEYFLTNRVALTLAYNQAEADGNLDDSDVTTLSIVGRF